MTLLAALYAYGLVGLCVSVTCARKVQGVFDVLVITALWPVVVGAWVLNAFRRVK